VIEDYGRFLKKKGKSILSEERVRVEPFTTSLLDGIDHARDHPQLARRQASTCGSFRRSTARWAR
jgi:hypothetical protein